MTLVVSVAFQACCTAGPFSVTAQPRIAASARVAPNAVVDGDVTIGENCSIGFGAVITAESGPVVIGRNCVIMDTAVLRGIRGNPLTLGDNVLVGPRAYLTGCTIAENAFLATGATVFNGARIGARAEARHGAAASTWRLSSTRWRQRRAVARPAKHFRRYQHERYDRKDRARQ